MYAKDTKVAPARSRGEIEQTVRRYGADAFGFGFDGDRALITFRMAGRHVRFEVTVPHEHADEIRLTYQGYSRTPAERRSKRAQIERQRWRALLLVIKAKLESIESGIASFEEEFLAHLVLPTGQTAGEWLVPQVAEAYETGEMPSLLPGGQRTLESGP